MKIKLSRTFSTIKGGSLKTAAILLSLLAGIAVYWTFNSLYKPVPVVVAAKDLDPLKPIKQSDITIGQVSRNDRQAQAFEDPKQVVGSYTAVRIFKGQQLISPQVVRDPSKMIVSARNMNIDETLLSLRSQDASWPPVLKTGDMVTVVAAFPDQVAEVGIGKVVSTSGGSVLQDAKNIREAQAQQSGEQIILSMKMDEAKATISALKASKGVYLLPRHPGY